MPEYQGKTFSKLTLKKTGRNTFARMSSEVVVIKRSLFSIFALLYIVSMPYLLSSFAQDYTQWELPEHAIARLGKGRIEDIQYSPDGTILAVATTIGIWIYDTETYQESALLTYQESALLTLNKKGVKEILFDTEGTTLASVHRRGGITLWDVGMQSPRKTLMTGSSLNHIMRFSPDGRIFANGGYEEVLLWDAVTGESKNILKAHKKFVQCLAFSPDGQTLASGGEDQTIHLWDVVTGKRKQTITMPKGTVTDISFSPDGNTFASVSDNKTIHLWDTTTWKHKKQVVNQGVITEQVEDKERIESVFFSPDGSTFAAVSTDTTIRLWDTTTGTLRQTFIEENAEQAGNEREIENVLFSPDGQSISSVSDYGKIRLWDVATGKRKRLSEDAGYVTKAAFNHNGRTLATGTYNGTIRLWDVATGKHKKTIPNFGAQHLGTSRLDPPDINNISLSPNGSKFVAGNPAETIYFWDSITRQQQPIMGQTHPAEKDIWFSGVLFSPDGDTLASWSYNYTTIHLWNITSKRKRTLTGHTGKIKRVTFSPDGKTLASWSLAQDKTIRLWDVATGKHKRTLTGHTELVESVIFSPDEQMLVSGGSDGTLYLWEIVLQEYKRYPFTNQRFANEQKAHAVAVPILSFNSDGSALASGSKSGSIYLWDVGTRAIKQTFKGHTDTILSISFGPDGQEIASTSKDATARLWDVATGKQKQAIAGYGGSVYERSVWHVHFSSSGLPLASEVKGEIGGVDDDKIRLWDLRTGQLKKMLTGHASWVKNLSFSADGKTIASLSFDATVILWDLTSVMQAAD